VSIIIIKILEKIIKFHDIIVDDNYLYFYINKSNINNYINVFAICIIKILN